MLNVLQSLRFISVSKTRICKGRRDRGRVGVAKREIIKKEEEED
jgi:hypothetical protein